MDHPSDKKSKRSLKPSQRHISLGIPTNVAIGPLGFRAELDIDPKGKQDVSPHNVVADRTGSTAVLDDNGTRASRIVLQDKEGEGQKPLMSETSTAGAVVGGDEHGGGPTSEHF